MAAIPLLRVQRYQRLLMQDTQDTYKDLYKRFVHIYTESNPNPNSMKFVANYMLVHEGDSFDFPDPASAEVSPLALELFRFNFVRRVFIAANFVTVTKDEQVDWFEVSDILRTFLKQYLESDKPVIRENTASQQIFSESDSEEVRKIKEILDEYVRPAVEQDGGAIHFRSFEEGVVKVQLQGSCSGCPSSTITLKAGIENLLKRMVPEVKEVVAEGV